MIKNLNDVLSLFTLLLIIFAAIRFVVSSFNSADKERSSKSIFTLVKNYDKNEEE